MNDLYEYSFRKKFSLSVFTCKQCRKRGDRYFLVEILLTCQNLAIITVLWFITTACMCVSNCSIFRFYFPLLTKGVDTIQVLAT